MIVSMQKICIAGIKKEKRRLLEFISNFGAVEIVSNLPEESAVISEISEELSENEKKLARTKTALRILKEFDTSKKPLFAEKISMTKEEAFSNSDKTYGDVKQIVRNKEELEFLKAQKPKFENERQRLMPYSSWTLSTNKKGTKETVFAVGFFDKNFDRKAFEDEIKELYAVSELLTENSDGIYYGFVIHKSSLNEFNDILKKYAFTRISDLNFNSNISGIIEILNVRIRNTDRKIEHYKNNLIKFAENTDSIKKYHDILENRVAVTKADLEIVSTNSAYVLEGYIPAEASEKIKSEIEKNFSASVFITDIPKGEDFPVQLENPKLIQPFEVVTEMYSTPASYGIDPSKVMAPFYFIFFGMMLSDAGYGLLLTLATGFVLLKAKPSGQFKKLCSLLCICGVSTFIFGLLFGSFFSDLISTLTLGKITQPALVNPMEDPMTVLLAGYVLGAVHIMTGLGVKAYMLIKNGKTLDAVFDVGSWYLVFIGIGLMLIPQTSGIAVYVILAGVIMLILTQGRSEKNIIKKFLSGVLSLYDATGFLSDILSYSRLLALGLSTAVVGMVVNKMGSMGASQGWTVSSAVIFTLVFILGHGFNIVINVLGSYVHTCRLMYIEFFSKFFESGGKMFTPLTLKNKFTKFSASEAVPNNGENIK